MKKFILMTLLMLFVFAPSAFADIALPKPTPTPVSKQTAKKKGVESRMTVRVGEEGSDTTLYLPRSTYKQLRAEFDEADESDMAAIQTNSTNTIIGGSLMSLALIFGGVWFVRSGKFGGKTAAGLLIFALFGAGATVVFANMAPPSSRKISSDMFSSEVQRFGYASGKIRIVVDNSQEAGNVTLVVSKDKPVEPKVSATPNQ
ncbi:MAG: hypothetical protein H7Z37_10440 [Pyrinomonadaceae bacterium]|nr:hypothetical protein [Pyrinomonadaceae bacterium]